MKRIAALAFLTMFSTVISASSQTQERLKFASGNDNAHASGNIRGDDYRDYLLSARKGQKMSASLSSKGVAYFNILPPGSDNEAIYNSSMDGNDGTLTLPTSGDYRIRVYLMGADASENKKVDYTFSVSVK